MNLTTKDIRVNGYPPLDVVLAHFDALPVLLNAVRRCAPEALVEWDVARQLQRPSRAIQGVSRAGENALNPDPVLVGS